MHKKRGPGYLGPPPDSRSGAPPPSRGPGCTDQESLLSVRWRHTLSLKMFDHAFLQAVRIFMKVFSNP